MTRISRTAVTCILATFAADVSAVTIRPKATDEALINPGMGLVHYAYSSRIWAYDTGIEPGNTLAVSVGRADGKPEIALPLAGGKNRMYPSVTIDVVR